MLGVAKAQLAARIVAPTEWNVFSSFGRDGVTRTHSNDVSGEAWWVFL